MSTPSPSASAVPTELDASPRALHWLALLTIVATFPLIFVGGLVTSHNAGLSVPDWPNSYGYNMFLFPPSMWIGGILYEHTHRLLGTLVGFLAVSLVLHAYAPARKPGVRKALGATSVVLSLLGSALLVATAAMGAIHPQGAESAFEKLLPHLATGIGSLALVAIVAWLCRRREPRRAVRWLTIVILGCVIVQGIKGGLRVELISLELAIAHGVFAQLILCLMAGLAVVTSRWWQTAPDLSSGLIGAGGRKVVTAAGVAFVLVMLQLIAGATMRHYGAGLAIPDLPLAYGNLLPPTSPEAIESANAFRVSLNDPHLKPVTRTEVLLHFSHRVGAVLVTLAVLHLCFTAFRRARGHGRVTILAGALLVMLVGQLTLGLLTVYYRKPADITTLHHTLGAVCMMTVFVLGLRAARLYRPRAVTVAATVPASAPVPQARLTPVPA